MTGSIRKRSASSWSIIVFLGKDPTTGKKKQKWSTVTGNKKDAERELTRLLRSLDTGCYVDPAKDTLGTFLERWLAAVKPNLCGKTYQRYREIVEQNIVPSLGQMVLSKLTPLHIQNFYSKSLESGRKDGRGGLSARTVLHFHRVLREGLHQGVKWQILARNPADAVDAPKPERKEMRALNQPETAWLTEVISGTRLYVPVLLAVTTGMRRGEFLALQWGDVDLERGLAAVNRSIEQTREGGLRFKSPKGKHGRSVVLPRMLIEVLKEHRRQQQEQKAKLGTAYQGPGLICAREDGSIWPPDTFSHDFAELAKKAGLKARLHDLRHTHATALLREGVHPKIVQERLGHSTVAITLDLYSHVQPGMQEDAVQKFDTALQAAIDKRQRETGRA